jgi:cytidyltransferase-like protein
MQYDIIILSGGFDPPHVGHVRMIRHASDLASVVIVGVNSDEWLMRKKGYVFMPWEERSEMMASIRGVGEAVRFDDSDKTANDLIMKVRKQFPNARLAFGNGGDRTNENTPEMQTCSKLSVEMIWGIGGEDKAQSSSTLVENARKNEG